MSCNSYLYCVQDIPLCEVLMIIWILSNLLLVLTPTCTAQFIPDNDDYQDDLSFLDVAMDRGENARLCVCQKSN